jgi:LuxR family transcriptional regulator
LPANEKAVLAFNLSQNVVAGYKISFSSVTERTKGATALTAKTGLSKDGVDAMREEYATEITVMNNVMHLKIQTLPYTYSQRNLTKRQREVL